MAKKLVQFDWAIKKLLRHKANFRILEGFLTELLGFDVKIESILESEGNKEDAADKHNKVDILVKASSGELMLVEVQNDPQLDRQPTLYFHRMLYGASKLITEYIDQGDQYGTIKKVFSVNIVYFGLGQGKDYIYEYKGHFEGRNLKDVLLPSSKQQKDYKVAEVADIFPKYYLLKVNNFDDVAKNTLDEWIYLLKNSEVKEDFSAKGLKEASEKLKEEALDDEDKASYKRYQENKRVERSVLDTAIKEGEARGEARGEVKGLSKIIIFMHRNGKTPDDIATETGISIEEVRGVIEDFA